MNEATISSQDSAAPPSATRNSYVIRRWKLLAILGFAAISLIFSSIGWYDSLYKEPRQPTDAEWFSYGQHLQQIRFKNYSNEEVVLDGMDIQNCTFVGVSFVYKGTKPFIFANNKIDAVHQPIPIKIAPGPAFAGSILTIGLLNEVCRSGEVNCSRKEAPEKGEQECQPI